MILIPTSEVKSFLKRSSKIRPNTLIPVLESIKLECIGDAATLTKSNMDAWCRHEVAADFKENQTLLLSEKLLSALVANSPEEIISIKREADNVVLACGKCNTSFAWEDPNFFPSFPEMNTQNGVTPIAADVLYSIRSALSILNTAIDNSYARCYVNFLNGQTEVFATNAGAASYLKTFPGRYPKMVISPEDGAIITMYEDVSHYEANNYDFFDCGKTVYGFVKSTYTPPGYSAAYRNVNNGSFFEVNKAALVQFLEFILKSTPVSFPAVSVTNAGVLGVSFEHSDAQYRIATKMDFEGEKNYKVLDVQFDVKLLLQISKSMDVNTIRISPIGTSKVYCLWSLDDSSVKNLLVTFAPPQQSK